jgi:putative IMPACT (imprinted ancient) family translation regulator
MATRTPAHCSDDGEPASTAGQPALAVLRGSGLGDVAVVVTRYFGGTKLGTGGLVRAYGDAVREVLAVLPRAAKVATHTVGVETPYPNFERVRQLIGLYGGRILDEDFGAQVRIDARFAIGHLPAFQAALREMSNGTLKAEITQTDETTIMPLDSKPVRGGKAERKVPYV